MIGCPLFFPACLAYAGLARAMVGGEKDHAQ